VVGEVVAGVAQAVCRREVVREGDRDYERLTLGGSGGVMFRAAPTCGGCEGSGGWVASA